MYADVADLADATDLGSVTRKGVEVRILSSALWARGLVGRRLLCTQETAGSNPAGSTRNRQQPVWEGSDGLVAALFP